MKKIWYLLMFLWHLMQRWRAHNKYVRSVRRSVFRQISHAYFHKQDHVSYRDREEFDLAKDIMSTLGIFHHWSHDGVFYKIYIDRGDEKAVH